MEQARDMFAITARSTQMNKPSGIGPKPFVPPFNLETAVRHGWSLAHGV
jgi:hypothetical protein